MRRWVAGVAGAVGLAGLYRLLRRRPPAPPDAADPAADLRRKLDEARSLAGEREEFEAGETPVDSLDARRRDVHERARSAIDEMRGE